ncbi:MAG: ABC transporter substrate-binding protein [Phycisphaera sp.]|nr:ABC transporter substrate-binding protein [Phycisphaera sp.]
MSGTGTTTDARPRRKSLSRRAARLLVLPLVAIPLTLVSCVRTSGGTWYFDSAPLPDGWPELTPVDEVEIREYPSYRAAVVTEEDGKAGTTPMFRSLFQHISSNDIPMTSPVDMTYDDGGSPDGRADGSGDRMTGMAFLYRTPDLGPVGTDGVVRVEDIAPRAYASTGVRGSYSQAHYSEGLARVNAWLSAQSAWKADGSSRYLGYNSPFVPWFWRYGEVQVPVVRTDESIAD